MPILIITCIFFIILIIYLDSKIKEQHGFIFLWYKNINYFIRNFLNYNTTYMKYHIKDTLLYAKLGVFIGTILGLAGVSIKFVLDYMGNTTNGDKLAFSGAVIASIVGILGTLIATMVTSFLNDRKERKKEYKNVCLLMKQVLYSYNRIIGLSSYGNPELSLTVHNTDHFDRLVFLEDWTKYLIHIDNLDDVQCIIIFLNMVEKFNIRDIESKVDTSIMADGYDPIRDSFFGIGQEMIRLNIDTILLKYDKLYLKGRFKKKYRVKDPYQ